ncbi:MAG: TonB-dependent receptor [Pseudomonadota bacterium]
MKLILIAPLIISVTSVAWGMETKPDLIPFEDLRHLDLEDLMQIDVVATSPAKKPQRLSKTAAAIFVITADDIRRSGVNSIPEALRMVPGVQVAHIDADKWAISVRGFNGRFSNKLLVLIDGRSVYTPLFTGVFWDEQDTLMEDIDRIEVIRGPGATVWGANAVNGVINIITKHAKDTQGSLVSLGAGTEERGFGGVRFGGAIGEKALYRVYAKYFKRDNFVDPSGAEAADDWQVLRSGFRMDWQRDTKNTVKLQGDIYDGTAGQTVLLPSLQTPFKRSIDTDISITGGNLLGHWRRTLGKTSELNLQIYYDHTTRDDPDLFKQVRDTVDIDFQHIFSMAKRHQISWGLGYRFNNNESTASFILTLDPDNRRHDLLNAFIQDEISLLGNLLRLTVGSKFEHNDFTGFEVQPNLRLIWTPNERHAAWAAISRAVRTPSRVEHEGTISQSVIPGAPPRLVSLMGDESFDSEKQIAFEFGYRAQPRDTLYFDVATFFNIYDDLRTLEPGTPFPELTPAPPHLVVPFLTDNKMHGETYGVELAADWRPLKDWRLRASYNFLQMDLRLDEGSGDIASTSAEGKSPQHQISLRSSFDLPHNLEIDLWLRYVDRLPSLDVDHYVTLDARMAWKVNKNLELSLVGQNLVESRHLEFRTEFVEILPTQVERGVYGKLLWRH